MEAAKSFRHGLRNWRDLTSDTHFVCDLTECNSIAPGVPRLAISRAHDPVAARRLSAPSAYPASIYCVLSHCSANYGTWPKTASMHRYACRDGMAAFVQGRS